MDLARPCKRWGRAAALAVARLLPLAGEANGSFSMEDAMKEGGERQAEGMKRDRPQSLVTSHQKE